VQLVGPEGLQDQERVILATGRALREDFLQQNAFLPTDMRCSLAKQKTMLEAILHFHRVAEEAVRKGVGAEKVVALPERELLSRMKEVAAEEIDAYVEQFRHKLEAAVNQLVA